jgi:hypothetical protein
LGGPGKAWVTPGRVLDRKGGPAVAADYWADPAWGTVAFWLFVVAGVLTVFVVVGSAVGWWHDRMRSKLPARRARGPMIPDDEQPHDVVQRSHAVTAWPAVESTSEVLSKPPQRGAINDLGRLPQQVQTDRLVTLREAHDLGIVPPSLDALRKASTRDGFPPRRGKRRTGPGRPEHEYSETELREWGALRRPSAVLSSPWSL